MAQPESKLSLRIRKELAKEWPDCFTLKVWGSARMMGGLPDILGCVRGRFIGLEVKMPDKRSNTTEQQRLRISQIQRAGGIAGVVCSPAEAVEFVRKSLPKKLR